MDNERVGTGLTPAESAIDKVRGFLDETMQGLGTDADAILRRASEEEDSMARRFIEGQIRKVEVELREDGSYTVMRWGHDEEHDGSMHGRKKTHIDRAVVSADAAMAVQEMFLGRRYDGEPT